jgi:hypothetical protein
MNMMNIDLASLAMAIGAVVALLLIAIAVAVVVIQQRKKSALLRTRFGPEYELAVRETGSRKKGEESLHSRVKRVEQFKIRDLTVAERDRYRGEWEEVQSRFIDHPRGAVTEADELVNSLLVARGYPAGGFAQQAADVSVNHSSLVGPYRTATGITSRAGKNEATTEEMRAAIIHYRTLFDALLGAKIPAEQAVLV